MAISIPVPDSYGSAPGGFQGIPIWAQHTHPESLMISIFLPIGTPYAMDGWQMSQSHDSRSKPLEEQEERVP